MFIVMCASLVFSPGGATSILSDVATDGAWTDYFLVSINIPPLRGSPPQNPLVPVELNGATRPETPRDKAVASGNRAARLQQRA